MKSGQTEDIPYICTILYNKRIFQLKYKLTFYLTTISAIISMDQSVLIVNRPGQKTLITHVTLERTFSSVDFSYMVLQIGPDSVSGFTTFVRTRKRLDS